MANSMLRKNCQMGISEDRGIKYRFVSRILLFCILIVLRRGIYLEEDLSEQKSKIYFSF